MKHPILSAVAVAALTVGLQAADATKTTKAPAKAAKPATKAAEPKEKAAPAKGKAPAAPAKEAPAATAKEKEEPKFELKDPVAVVDGVEIKAAEVDKVLKGLLARQGGSLDQVPADMKPQLYRNVIDGVIVDKLVAVQAAKVEVTDADVTAEFEKFKGQFGGDEKALAEELKNSGQTTETVRGDIKRFLQQNRWVDAQIKGKIEVSDAETEEFYKGNPEQFKQPAQVRASHILVRLEKDAKEDEVKTKRAAADQILSRVKKGEDFQKLATEVSEDPSAKKNGGDLNYFDREQMVPEFADAAFKMKKDEVSAEPVRSPFGFHIIKVTDHKDAGTVTLAEAKPKLVEYLQNQKRQGEVGKVLRSLRENAKVTINLPEAPKGPEAPPAAPGAPAAPDAK
jgi:parvulin-like peptidyl-prolyl isomerase